MSAKAARAVAEARELADDLFADGQFRAAEIIRRVCRSNDSYRTTLAQLWHDNMALRREGVDSSPVVDSSSDTGPSDIPAQKVFEALDGLSRKRALSEAESAALEAAMGGRTILTKREAARLGIKRVMS